MSNSFSSTPTLVDPSRVTAGQTIRATEADRLCDLQNYVFANGGTHNVLSQTYDDSCFRQNSTSFVPMCEWYIPILSRSHNDLVINLSAYCATSGGQVRFTITFPVSTNKYITTINVTDTSRYGGVFDTGTITKSAIETEEFVILGCEVKAPTGDEVEVLGIMARWSPLTSPLSGGVHNVGTARYIPQGATRQSADRPLTARFGVETLENINIMRQRGRVLVNWSGVASASSASALSAAANPPIGLGVADRFLLFSEAALFAGMNETDNLRVRVFVRVLGLTGSNTITIDVFGFRLTMSSNAWHVFNLSVILGEIERSDEFGLSMYRVGLDQSVVNYESLLSAASPIASNPYIASLSIIGV